MDFLPSDTIGKLLELVSHAGEIPLQQISLAVDNRIISFAEARQSLQENGVSPDAEITVVVTDASVWIDSGSTAPCIAQCKNLGKTCDDSAYKALAEGGEAAITAVMQQTGHADKKVNLHKAKEWDGPWCRTNHHKDCGFLNHWIVFFSGLSYAGCAAPATPASYIKLCPCTGGPFNEDQTQSNMPQNPANTDLAAAGSCGKASSSSSGPCCSSM